MSEPITLTERERHTADMLAVAIKKWLADSGFVDTARAEGFRAGIGMAAKWHDEWARSLEASSDKERSTKILAEAHRVAATAIRALADTPAPDPLLAGLAHVREHLRTDGHAVRLIAWLDAEIAKRGGTEGG